jgi:hypothetical protein
MGLKKLKRFELSTNELNKLQENVANFTDQLNDVFLNGRILLNTDGSVIEGITVQTTTTNIPHGLGRAYQGWVVIDVQGNARVWRDATAAVDSTKFLPLVASSSVTIKLWVF